MKLIPATRRDEGFGECPSVVFPWQPRVGLDSDAFSAGRSRPCEREVFCKRGYEADSICDARLVRVDPAPTRPFPPTDAPSQSGRSVIIADMLLPTAEQGIPVEILIDTAAV